MDDGPGAAAEPLAGQRIGPNAIIRTREALSEHVGDELCARIFLGADLEGYLATEPTTMVPEVEVVALHRALRRELAPATADAVVRDAGARTARYLLTHRIPKPAQVLLRALPARLAARLLLALIARHAWTFAGSARLTIVPGRPARVHFDDSPFARVGAASAPVCGFYVGTFEVLFRDLVHPATRGRETTCAAVGDDRCTLSLDWRR